MVQKYNTPQQATLHVPSNSNWDIIAVALQLLRRIYRTGYRYKKTGIFLTGLVPEKATQLSLFSKDQPLHPQKKALEAAMDQLNRKMGKDTVRYGITGMERKWTMRSDHRSNRFTTNWNELPIARA